MNKTIYINNDAEAAAKQLKSANPNFTLSGFVSAKLIEAAKKLLKK